METIEEAALKHCLINNIPIDQMIVKTDRSCEFETSITMFIEGANWQSKRMYSEENLKKAIEYGYQLRNNHRPINSGIDWVKEFKNKININKL